MKLFTRSLVGLFVLFSFYLNAQQGINYKALIKDSGGNVVANQSIDIQFQILQGAGMYSNRRKCCIACCETDLSDRSRSPRSSLDQKTV